MLFIDLLYMIWWFYFIISSEMFKIIGEIIPNIFIISLTKDF